MTYKRLTLITGAAGGIGRALTCEFINRGYRVIAVDLPSSDIHDFVAGLEGDHISIACDLSDETEIAGIFNRIGELGGRLDVLVNNAAIGPTMRPTLETSTDEIRAALRTNLYAPFTLAREAMKFMAPDAAIVNTASLGGINSNPARNAYAASKAALISLTKSLSCEMASKGIRVCAVAPGYVRTPMVAGLEAEGKADLALVRRRIPMGRLARPDEIAAVIGFLASPQARYITGSFLVVDGGWNSFNQAGFAHPQVDVVPEYELAPPETDKRRKTILITGAAKGIGEAIAERFAAGGARVLLADSDFKALSSVQKRLGGDHLAIETDIADDQSVVDLFARVAQECEQLDVLINNAAISDVFKPLEDQTVGDLDRVMAVNLAGAFSCAREALKLMRDGNGVIVNLGSINTFLPFAPRHAYGASKAAIDMLTRCMAAELGPRGIRSVSLAPGYIRTSGVADLEDRDLIDIGAIKRRIPMGDLGRPADIAEAAHFLASDAASYVSGAILYVDGGWTSFGNAGDAAVPSSK